MHFETTYQLEDFILNTNWNDVPYEVQQRMKGCFVDLMGALVIGKKTCETITRIWLGLEFDTSSHSMKNVEMIKEIEAAE